MKKILLLLAIVAATFTAEAQDEFTFGKIRKAELRKCDYSLSSNADAVVLDEYIRIMPSLLDVQVFINAGQTTPMIVREVVARKVKILAENVADNNKIQIPLKNISDTERENCEPHSIWAQCYTLKNGHIVKHNGDPNELYYDVKEDNATLRFNSKAMANFKYQGMTYKAKAPMPGGMGYVNNITNDSMAKLVGYDFSVNVQSGGMVLITEFYDAEKDQYGYCVVNGSNPAYTSEVVVTLDFGSMQNAQIYQNLNILNVKANNGKITINLGTGRSAFVMPY
jgi:hypothetical protein